MLAGFESRKVNVGRKKKLLYCEADFKSAISAFDDTVTQAFGVPKRHLSQDRLNTTNKFAHENDFGDVTFIPRRKTAYVPTGNLSGFAISPPESHAIQMSNDGLLSGRLQEPQPIHNSSNLRAPFPSTTQSHQSTTENRNAECCERSVVKPLAFTPSFASAPALIQNGWQSRSIQSAIELLEVDSDSVDIALGVPNSRKPPAVPAAPRICRARSFFSQLKSGLSEWIELQTTLLQQAELGQDVATEKLVSEFLSRLQRRLSTITRLEEEYIRFYRVYRQRRSKYTERRPSKSIQPTPITQLSRGLSKSVSALTTSDSYEPFDVTPKQDSRTLQTSVHCVWGTCLLSAVPPRLTHKEEHPDNERETLSIPDRNSVTNTSAYSSLGTEVRPKRQKSHLLSRAPRFMKSELLLEPNVKYEQFLKHLLCLIEAQTEYLSGTFKCEVIGISGAGQCFNKDEFKVNFVYGPPTLPTLYEIHDKEVKLLPVRKSSIETENVVHLEDKWIAHGRIHCTQSVRKNHDRIPLSACENVPVDYSFPKQIWDNPCNIFSPLIDSVLTLKAVEVKRFGKVEILQHQSYDIISLFRSKYFQLSTPLKHNGQLKFHFLIGWSPLADTNDQNLIYYSPHSRYGSASSGTSKTKLLSSACLNLNDPSPVSLKGDGSQTTDWEPSPVSDRTSVASSNVESSTNMSRTRSCILYPAEKKKSSASNNVTNVSANSGICVKEDSGKTTQWSRWISTPNLGKAVANARLRLNTGCLREISIRPRKKTQNGVTIEPSAPQLSTDSLCSFIAETQPAKSDSPSSVSSQREFEDELQFVIDKLQNLLRLNDEMKTVLQPLRCVLLKLQSSIQQPTFGKRNSAVAKLSSLRKNGLSSQFVTNSMIKSKAENGKPGKSDTLTDLWESFAFLDCSKPMEEGACNEDSTDAVFGLQLQSVSLPNVSATQAPLDGSYHQLGSTVLWHLNYVTRLFDRLSQLHEVTCNQADEKVECLSPLFFPGSISLCFVEMSLSIQVSVTSFGFHFCAIFCQFRFSVP
ncbi:unnamed protein product [Dicrocoelium dendriticum]|nr:unnamed protein product [Dicrocoelium dendriticum]